MLEDSFRPRRSLAALCETNFAGSRARRIANPPQLKKPPHTGLLILHIPAGNESSRQDCPPYALPAWRERAKCRNTRRWIKSLSAWPCRATKVDQNQCWRTVFDHAAHWLRFAKRTLQEAGQGGLKIRRSLKSRPTLGYRSYTYLRGMSLESGGGENGGVHDIVEA